MKTLTIEEKENLLQAVYFYIEIQCKKGIGDNDLTAFMKVNGINKNFDLMAFVKLKEILEEEVNFYYENYDISNEISSETDITLNCDDDDIIKDSVNDIFCVSEAEIEQEQIEAAEWYDNGIFK